MARSTRPAKPVLPGKSRSPACSVVFDDGRCGRLRGHHGDHRASLHVPAPARAARPTKSARKVAVNRPKVDRVADRIVLNGVEYQRVVNRRPKAVPAPKPVRPTVEPRTAKPRAVRRPVGQCRVVRDEVRCGRAYGHKQAGKRHSFAVVRVLADVAPKGRDVQTVKGKPSRRHNYVVSGKPSTP